MLKMVAFDKNGLALGLHVDDNSAYYKIIPFNRECEVKGKTEKEIRAEAEYGNRTFELKEESFLQAMGDTRFSDLRTALVGTWPECEAYAKEHGYAWKRNDDLLFGGYWWNEEAGITLYPV